MPVYRADHECKVNGSGAWRFFHKRTDAVEAVCPACGVASPVVIEEVPK